jgi:hypothetical protein
MDGQLGQPAQILGDRGAGKFELGAPWAAEPQPAATQDAFEMREQHLHFFAIAPSLRIGFSFGQRTGDIAPSLVYVAWHFAWRQSRAATGFERARTAIMGARPIEQRRPTI